MPNRYLKESVCTSEDIAKLSVEAERLFYRLIVKADDYGAYYGNEAIIRGNCFPLISDSIKIHQVTEWLCELADVGLIWRYQAADGRSYIQFRKWANHQQIRAKEPKYPLYDETCLQLESDDSKCPRNTYTLSNTSTNTMTSTNASKSHFVKPNIDEIREYISAQNCCIDPEAFYDYYESNGWKVGKNPMKDWKACIRQWKRRNNGSYSDVRDPKNAISYTPDDIVEYPDGSGNYALKTEVPSDG